MGPVTVPLRVIILATFVLALAVFAGLMLPSLRPRAGAEQFFRPDFWASRFLSIQFGAFPPRAGDVTSAVTFVWGVRGVDRSGVALLRDPTYFGAVDWAQPPLRLTPAFQEHVLHVCNASARLPFVQPTRRTVRSCPIGVWREWLAERSLPFPVEPEAAALALLGEFLADTPDARPWVGLQLRNATPTAGMAEGSAGASASAQGGLAEGGFAVESTNATAALEVVAVQFVTASVQSLIVEAGYQTQAELRSYLRLFDEFVGGAEVNGRVPADGRPLFPPAFHTCSKWVALPHTAHSHTVHRALGALLSPCTVCVAQVGGHLDAVGVRLFSAAGLPGGHAPLPSRGLVFHYNPVPALCLCVPQLFNSSYPASASQVGTLLAFTVLLALCSTPQL